MTFQKEIIAEGVETVMHGSILLLMGCEKAQGYAIAKPMPADEISKWLDSWHSPLEWKQQIAYSQKNISLVYAIAEHRVWVKRICDYLIHRSEKVPSVEIGECKFGEWLNSTGAEILSEDIETTSLINLHNNIHELAKTMIENSINYTTENIENEINKLLQIRDQIVNKLLKSTIVLD